MQENGLKNPSLNGTWTPTSAMLVLALLPELLGQQGDLIASMIMTVKIIFTKIIPFFFTFENNTSFFYFTGTIIVRDALRRFQELKLTLGRIPHQWKGERLLSLRYLLFQYSHWLVGILKVFWMMQCFGISFILLVELKWLLYFTYSAWWLRKNSPGQRMIILTWNRKETWLCSL